VSEIPRQNPLGYQHTLKKMDRKVKQTSLFWEWVLVGGHKERVKKSEYDGCILYSCMQVE
jgi:hypothetical protein